MFKTNVTQVDEDVARGSEIRAQRGLVAMHELGRSLVKLGTEKRASRGLLWV
jgi:hypothetical protein